MVEVIWTTQDELFPVDYDDCYIDNKSSLKEGIYHWLDSVDEFLTTETNRFGHYACLVNSNYQWEICYNLFVNHVGDKDYNIFYMIRQKGHLEMWDVGRERFLDFALRQTPKYAEWLLFNLDDETIVSPAMAAV